jgi:hypothetical protein
MVVASVVIVMVLSEVLIDASLTTPSGATDVEVVDVGAELP